MGRILLFWLWLIFALSPLYPTDTFLVPAESSEATELLKQGDEYERQGEWQKAIASYQKIIQEYACRVVAVDTSLYQSAYDVALQRIWRLPPQALQLYRDMLQHQVETMLQQADRSPHSVYPFFLAPLPAGTNGIVTRIDRYLANEQYAQALPYLAEYLYHETSRVSLPKSPDAAAALARLAFSYFAMGEAESLAELPRRYKRWGKEALVISDREQSLNDYVASLLLRHKEAAKISDADSTWPLLGKSAARLFHGEDIFSLPPLWMIPLVLPPRDATPRYYYNETYRQTKGPIPVYPVLADNCVFVNNGKDVFAYQLWSGKLKWHFPGLITRLKSDAHEQVVNSVTYWQGAIYANVEGETPSQRRETWSSFQIRKILPERKLIKLDAATGKLLWQLKDAKGDEEAFANKASFMSPPAPCGNLLYAGATELTGLFNSYVVAVEPEQGQIVWKTLVGSAQQELNMFGRPVRESVGSVVATGNGRLYYLNNLGACASVDPVAGRLLWVYVYDRIPLMSPDHALFTTIYRDTGFSYSPLILHGDSLYVAPIDANELYCLDGFTGKVKWRYQRKNHNHLLAVTNGKVVLAGQYIELLNADSGAPLKTFALDTPVAGLGIAGRFLYVPSAGYLYAVDSAKQELNDLERWPRPNCGGHAAIADGVLVTASSQSLQAFADSNQLETKWQQACKEVADSPLPYLKLARLYQEKGLSGLERAENMYQKVHELAQTMRAGELQTYFLAQAERGLLQIYLRQASQYRLMRKWEETQQFYNKALVYARKADDIISILFAQYEYYKNKQQTDEVYACLNRLRREFGQRPYYVAELSVNVPVALYATVLLAQQTENGKQPSEAVKQYQLIVAQYARDHYEGQPAGKWAKNNLQRLIREHGQSIYAAYDKEALQSYQSILQKKASSRDILAIIERYPVSQYIPQLTIEMSKVLSQEGRHRDAIEYLRRFVREYAQTPQALSAYLILIPSYETMQMYDAAKQALSIMERDYSDEIIQQDGRSISVRSYIELRLAQGVYRTAESSTLPWLNLWETTQPCYLWAEPSSNNLLRLIEVVGTPPHSTSLMFFALGQTLSCRDGTNGAVRWKTEIGWVRGVGFLGGRLFTWTRDEIACLNVEQGNILWRCQVPTRFVSLTLAENSVAAVFHDSARDIVSIQVYEPVTGERRWRAEFSGKEPGDILLASGRLLVFAKNPASVYVYELGNGKLCQEFKSGEEEKDQPLWGCYPVLISDNNLCLARDSRWLECYRLPSLEMVWRYDAGIVSLPTITANAEYISFVAKNNQLFLLDAANGKTKWSCQLESKSTLTRLLLDCEHVYFVETRSDVPDSIQLWFLDIQDGSVQCICPLSEAKNGNVSMLLTQQYLLVLVNRWAQGWQSTISVFDKFQGKVLRQYQVKGKDRGRTATEMCVRAGKLWLIKDNMGWALEVAKAK
jgi:outer membrane protein assembly factor BamB/outer membrane protein assembly factor BamD (BamD/ComL family)